jgi:hypothetical protein
VEIADWQQVGFALSEPGARGRALALGDVPRNVEKGGAALLALSLLGSGC